MCSSPLRVYLAPHVWTPAGRFAGAQTLRVEVAIRKVIFAQITGFRAVPEVDEALVVDNNSSDGTGDLARKAGARVALETPQGYGHACR